MPTTHKPNILLIVSDDHAAPAISCYGSEINRTPNIDRIGDGGMRFDNCFCTKRYLHTSAWLYLDREI